LGPGGWAGIVLLLVGLGTLWGGVLPLRDETDRLRGELSAGVQKPNPIEMAVPPDQLLAEELAAFQKRFPTVHELSDQLGALFTLAREKGLEVNKGEYALVEKAGGPLRRFEATLPVTGAYSQVRDFVLVVLEKLPSIALADIALERGKVAEGRPAVNLRFVFFVRKSA
jgi:Tfp pilus assembly protein PilO